MIQFQQVKAQPSHLTFEIPPIKKFINKYRKGVIIDPFPHPFKQDAIEYLKSLEASMADLVLYDGPYSQRQLREMYQNLGYSYDMNSSYWKMVCHEIARILKPGGICIKFAWNSGRIYKGFEVIDGMIVCHGAMHNDTIVSAQKKMMGL